MGEAVMATIDVTQLWLKKAEAMQAIYLLTLEQSKACAGEDTGRLHQLLEQRQNWMDQVDKLDGWIAALDAQETVRAGAVQEEIKELLKKIRQVDEYNIKIAADKLQDIKNGIRGNSRMKLGMRSYIQAGAVADGMYFDAKK